MGDILSVNRINLDIVTLLNVPEPFAFSFHYLFIGVMNFTHRQYCCSSHSKCNSTHVIIVDICKITYDMACEKCMTKACNL